MVGNMHQGFNQSSFVPSILLNQIAHARFEMILICTVILSVVCLAVVVIVVCTVVNYRRHTAKNDTPNRANNYFDSTSNSASSSSGATGTNNDSDDVDDVESKSRRRKFYQLVYPNANTPSAPPPSPNKQSMQLPLDSVYTVDTPTDKKHHIDTTQNMYEASNDDLTYDDSEFESIYQQEHGGAGAIGENDVYALPQQHPPPPYNEFEHGESSKSLYPNIPETTTTTTQL